MIPQVKVPTFSMTLPVSKQNVEFRPFLVKEEKILLLAKDSKEPKDVARVIRDVVESCTFNNIQSDKICLADLQYAFMQIRGKSIGEQLDLTLICGNCKAKHNHLFSIDDFQVTNLEINNMIQMGDVTVKMILPTIEHYIEMHMVKDMEDVFSVLASCIEKIYSEEEVYENNPENKDELLDFLNGLPSAEFNKIQEYFQNMPLLYKDMSFTCKSCDTPNNIRVDSLNNFF